MSLDLAIANISQLFEGRIHENRPVVTEAAAVGFSGGEVVYTGPTRGLPEARRVIDAEGLVGLPGLVDSHTHTLFAGSRAEEFEQRLAGASYTAILEQGGGILSTVQATRAASTEELRDFLERRLERMLLGGVTTVEVKSGYGLDVEPELRMLRAISTARTAVEALPTFLGAHAIPADYRHRREAYVQQVIEEQLPVCAPHARYIDVYCDRGAFTLEESAAILEAGRKAGLVPRIHAEQVAHTGAAVLAARLGASSADHLERVDDEGMAAMARAGTVAVLLPGAMLYLRDPAPPVAALREAGVAMAVATDFNPGSSPVRDLLACATLACLHMDLRVDEALLGVTRNAGRALGREDLGWIGPGSAADLVLFPPPPGELPVLPVLVQYMGGHRAQYVVKGGRLVVEEGTRVAADR